MRSECGSWCSNDTGYVLAWCVLCEEYFKLVETASAMGCPTSHSISSIAWALLIISLIPFLAYEHEKHESLISLILSSSHESDFAFGECDVIYREW